VTDFVVRTDTPYARLEDTFERRFACSTEHSHSGYNAARYLCSSIARRLADQVEGPYVRQRAVTSPSMRAEERERVIAALVTAHGRQDLIPVMRDLLLLRSRA
jgi:hypothetical protein